MADTPTFISRLDAAKKLKALLCPRCWKPNWNRIRNYEYEQDLSEEFGGEWVISEWCPFNGPFCSYRDHASAQELLACATAHDRAGYYEVADDLRKKAEERRK